MSDNVREGNVRLQNGVRVLLNGGPRVAAALATGRLGLT